MLKKVLNRLRGSLPDRLDYHAARDVLEMQRGAQKLELAGRADVAPEMLYYLARDPSVSVRSRVAANPATPIQANEILTDDENAEVRTELARKIARLMPGLAAPEQEKLRERTLALLEKLAADELPRVRRIVAEEIKRLDGVPKTMVVQLAQDAEITVAAPVLQYSPLLSDDDLREIIAASHADGAIEAIARRDAVSEAVSDAIAATLDVPGIAALLVNANAQIREDTLEAIIDSATEIDGWHGPLALRPGLSIRAMRRIAGFVASALVDQMASRNALDDEAVRDLKSRVRDRLKEETSPSTPPDALAAARSGQASDEMFLGWIDTGQRPPALEALAANARLPLPIVNAIIASGNARAVTSLMWKAGFSMRTAIKAQTVLARIPGKDILPARHGTEYPLTPEEMTAMLEIYGA